MTAHRTLFLIDGLGAVVSTLCLIGLFYCEGFSGMPDKYLLIFIGMGSLLAVFSLSCYFKKSSNEQKKLKAIAAANALYCLLTAFSVLLNADRLTLAGFIYFFAEIIIIAALAIKEARTSIR